MDRWQKLNERNLRRVEGRLKSEDPAAEYAVLLKRGRPYPVANLQIFFGSGRWLVATGDALVVLKASWTGKPGDEVARFPRKTKLYQGPEPHRSKWALVNPFLLTIRWFQLGSDRLWAYPPAVEILNRL